MSDISRSPGSREEARTTYDRLAPVYEWLEGYWGRRARQSGLASLNPRLGERILEIGYGTGHALVQIARAVGDHGHVRGIDISPRMAATARKRLRQAGLSNRATVEVGDVLETQLEEVFYDGIFMSFTLELFDTPGIPQLLGNCRHALKDTGRICVVALTKSGRPTRIQRIYEWAHERWPRILDCRPIYVERMLSDAGFNVVDARSLRLYGLPVAVAKAKLS